MSASDPIAGRPDRSRFDSPQGNVTGLGIIASYSARFWAIVIALGVVSGLGAALLVGLLRLVQRLLYGVNRQTLLSTVESAASWKRVAGLVLAAVIVTIALKVLGRRSTGGTEVTEGIWLRAGKLDFWRSIARGVLSIVAVGMGVSLGREAGPQIVGAAFGSRVSDWAKLPVWQRRLLVASGAGAGFAAVYNVPLGGTLLAMEVMLGTLALALVLPALLCAVTATAVGWIFLGHNRIYLVPPIHFHPSQLVFAILMGPIIGLAATGWARLIGFANRRRPTKLGQYIAPFAVFMVLGLASLQYPLLLGNGHGIVRLAILGSLSLGLLVVLAILKPIATAACIATGCPGGLFTPTFAVGVLLAGVGGSLYGHIWHGSLPGSYALIGGGAFLAAAMQGPLTGAVLVLELTGHAGSMMVPTLIAVVEATVLARRFGAASIYSARLASGGTVDLSPTANAASIATLHALDGALPPEGYIGPEKPETGPAR